MTEFLSMKFVMAGMAFVATLLWTGIGGERGPLTVTFWFVMSMALLAGFVVAYPINWWLVAMNLKHGMSTADVHAVELGVGKRAMTHPAHSTRPTVSMRQIVSMVAFSTIVLGLACLGAAIVRANGGM